MNIDTLNAYCGPWLVYCPCLTQGRLNIHPNLIWTWALFEPLVQSGFQVFDWWLHLASPILGFRPGLAATGAAGRLGELLLLLRPTYTFDLRVGKITRRI